MKKIISSVLACAALFAVAATASATTSNYHPTAQANKGIEYTMNASLFEKSATIDVIIPTSMEAAIMRTYSLPTNKDYQLSDSDNKIGEIDGMYLGMSFFSPEYRIVNKSDIPIRVYANVSAKTRGKVNLLDEKKFGVNVESDSKKNLRLWLSHSLTEGGTTPQKVNGQDAFEPDVRGDILITKKAAAKPYILFDWLGTDIDNRTGFFKINGQAKEIPNPYWDNKDGVNIKFVLKITPSYAEQPE